MNTRTRKYMSMYLWIAFLFCVAVYLKFIPFRSSRLNLMSSVMSCVIFICVFVHWMLSVKWRCMHKRIRNHLMAVGGGMIFWMILMLLKDDFAVLPMVKRQLWYFSFIPIILIPLMEIGAASFVTKTDIRPYDKRYQILWIPSVILCLIVLTNEFHGLVFDTALYETHDVITNHSPLCWTIVFWAVFLEIIAIATLIIKSRGTTLRFVKTVVPLAFLVSGLLYVALYLVGVIDEDLIAMPTAVCFFHLAICESCLFLRLLPTNFYYRQFFENADIGMQLLDHTDEVKIRSHKARALTKEENAKLKEHGAMLVDGYEIHCEPVQGGFFIYEKDIRNITEEIEQLKVTTGELEDTNNYIKEQQQLLIRKRRLEEKEKIFYEISHIITPYLDIIDAMLENIDKMNVEEQRHTMWLVNLLGTYIKRRANLELRRKESPTIFGSELTQCLSEFSISLQAIGITSSCFCEAEVILSPAIAILLLNLYANMIEENNAELKNISVIQSYREGKLCFFIEGTGRKNLSVSDRKAEAFTEYGTAHNIKVLFESDEVTSTLCYTVLINSGRDEK